MSIDFSKTLEKLSQLFFKNNYELYMVGGAVRDILMDKTPHDYDFATNATPDQMFKIAEKSNIEVIYCCKLSIIGPSIKASYLSTKRNWALSKYWD